MTPSATTDATSDAFDWSTDPFFGVIRGVEAYLGDPALQEEVLACLEPAPAPEDREEIHCEVVRSIASLLDGGAFEAGEDDDGGLAAVDAAALCFLRTRYGDAGKREAEELEKSRRKKWEALRRASSPEETNKAICAFMRLWSHDKKAPRCRLAARFARAAWDEMRARREGVPASPSPATGTSVRTASERTERPPALSIVVAEAVSRSHRAHVQAIGQALVDARHEPIAELRPPSVDLDTARGMLPRRVPELSSLAAYRLLVYEVSTGHAQELARRPRPDRIDLPGGWAALAEAIGAREERDKMPALIRAQSALLFRWPDGSSGDLITHHYTPHPAHLTITLGVALMPGFINRFRGSSARDYRRARGLVPIVAVPPLVGRPADHGAVAAYHLRLLIELRERVPEIDEHGGVLLPRDALVALAAEVGLRCELVPSVVDRWLRNGDDGPALLERVDRDRYIIGPAHPQARRMLEHAAADARRGRAAGRRSVAARRRSWSPRQK